MAALTWTDQEIVSAIVKGGDEGNRALEHLLICVFGASLKYLSRQYQYEEDELLRDLYIHLLGPIRDWHTLKTWNGQSSLKTWLNVVTTRLCLDYRRKLQKDSARFQRLGDWDGAPEAGATSAQELDFDQKVNSSKLLRAIERLPTEQQKLLIIMHCLEERPLGEVARDLQITVKNAYVIKHRAINKLRDLLGGGLGDV